MGMEKYVENITFASVEKRYLPSRHFVFVLQVTWSDGLTVPIFRKYSDFYDFHIELVELFPKEAGFGPEGTTVPRVLPYLPGRKLLQFDQQKLAHKRRGPLDEYCRSLVKLGSDISQHSLVIELFSAKTEDINPPKDTLKKPDKSRLLSAIQQLIPGFIKKTKETADIEELYVSGPVNFDTYYAIAAYRTQTKGELSLESGQEVEVVEKNDNGWWFLSAGNEQGWAPASFLEPANNATEMDAPDPLANGEVYFTLEAYEAQMEDEVSFPPGVILQVIHKLLDGWWIVSYEGKVGHAPATYLQAYTNPHFNPASLASLARASRKKPRAPTQRRCTIKNGQSKWGANQDTGKADMKTYRKMSVKIAQQRNKAPAKPIPKARSPKSPIQEIPESPDDLYVNGSGGVQTLDRSNFRFPQPRFQNDKTEEKRATDSDYLEIDESQISDADYEIKQTPPIKRRDYVNMEDQRPESPTFPYEQAPVPPSRPNIQVSKVDMMKQIFAPGSMDTRLLNATVPAPENEYLVAKNCPASYVNQTASGQSPHGRTTHYVNQTGSDQSETKIMNNRRRSPTKPPPSPKITKPHLPPKKGEMLPFGNEWQSQQQNGIPTPLVQVTQGKIQDKAGVNNNNGLQLPMNKDGGRKSPKCAPNSLMAQRLAQFEN